jgi:hypothetical protein
LLGLVAQQRAKAASSKAQAPARQQSLTDLISSCQLGERKKIIGVRRH